MKLEFILLSIGVAVIVIGMTYLQYSPDTIQNNVNIVENTKMCNYRDTTQDPLRNPEFTNFIGLPPNDASEITNQQIKVSMSTTEGDIELQLFPTEAPCTVNSFVYLAENNFYDNLVFHRVIEDFMIQGGDPSGTGAGGPGYAFDDEQVTRSYTRGIIAMANSGPNTNGSQFFIMHNDTPLPASYTIFGEVVSGIETVDKIATGEVEGDSPVNPVTINSITIARQ